MKSPWPYTELICFSFLISMHMRTEVDSSLKTQVSALVMSDIVRFSPKYAI